MWEPIDVHRGSVYYARGELLRSKHALVRTESGRAFERWALDLVPIDATTTILDAGCGWGRFVWPLLMHYGVPPERLVAADLSEGMLRTAVQEATRRGLTPALVAASIEALPLQAGSFDGVLANHVLYHLTNIEHGVAELARGLKPDGWLLATTNSTAIRVPLLAFHARALAALDINEPPEDESPFSLENGTAILQTAFGQVHSFVFEDEQVYGDVDAFVSYYQTMGRYRNVLAREDVPTEKKQRLVRLFRDMAQEVVGPTGEIRSPMRMGAFVCRESRM